MHAFPFWIYVIRPYKPSILFMGHRQTVQTKTQNHNEGSEQDLHLQNILSKIGRMKYTNPNPGNWKLAYFTDNVWQVHLA